MYKLNFKSFILGIVLALFLTSNAGVLAANLKTSIDVVYNNIKLVVDGETVSFGKDSAGKQIEPFIYNGTTYLPVRAVGEAMGKAVNWDGSINTVYIGKVNDSDADQLLSDLDYFSSSGKYQRRSDEWFNRDYIKVNEISSESKDNSGKTHSNGLSIILDSPSSWPTKGLQATREYLINQEYSNFKGTFALDYLSRDNEYANAKLKIYGDDKLIYTSDSIVKGTQPIKFDVNVDGVIKLKLEVVNDNSQNVIFGGRTIYLGIFDAGFYR